MCVCLKMIKSLIYARVVLKFLFLVFLLSIVEGTSEFDKLTRSSTILEYMEECETTPWSNSRTNFPVSGSTSINSGGEEDVAVSCHLRTINSEFDKTNFSRIFGNTIVSLTLQCSDVLFYQSSLQPNSFSHITRLESIHIEHCKLSHLPTGVFSGLSNIRNITVRTHNTAWPALSLDIGFGTFDSLPYLERIDLSENNIWTFPEKLFCSARTLESLNVSLNRLQDISDLNFYDKDYFGKNLKKSTSTNNCKSGINILDISNNRLILLPSSGLGTLSQLNELYVQDNEISVVNERALVGLKILKLLNLAHNKVVSLPEGLFQDSIEITEIYLNNNSLSLLPPKLFAKLNQLVVLDLSHNTLTLALTTDSKENINNPERNKGTLLGQGPIIFSGLIRLVLLNLSYNRLTYLQSNTFSDLYSLQILNIEHNLIQSIEGNTFSPMKNLHTLILSHNALTSIDSTSLNGLFVLSLLSLNNNNITRIDPSAFLNCSSLKDLNLNGNGLKNIPLALQNLTFLKTVDLGENIIEQIEKPKLIGLPNLYGLRLTGNRIVNISKNAFEELVSLKVLNLARNRIQIVEQNSFDTNFNLQAVRLDSNFLIDISNLFVELPNLIWLNISDNQLNWFDYSLIPKQLQWLDLHKNEIIDLGNYFNRIDLKLQTLDASFNRIIKLNSGNIPDSLEILFLNDNLISTIEPHTFYNKTNLSRVDIFANQIETMDLSSLRLLPFPKGKSLPEFYIGGNPILCDCNMEWLQRINTMDHLRQHPKIMDLDNVYCKLVYHREKYYLPIAQANPGQYLCSYKTHCFALCHCCDFDACDCEMTCPNNCTCYHDDTWSTNIVDCAGKSHIQIPTRIPMDSTEIYLDGNKLYELKSHMFIGRKNLQVLYLNHSEIYKISNNSFSGLRRLTILHLENNFINELFGYEFEPLENIRELYLQSNQLNYISNNSFINLLQLEIIKLDGNHLNYYSVWILSQNSYLVEITLNNNPWSCECDFLSVITPWIKINSPKIIDPSKIQCEVNGKFYSFFNSSNITVCTDIEALSGPVESNESSLLTTYIIVLIGVSIIVCLIFCSIIVVLCRKKMSLRIWAENKCSLKQCYESTSAHEIEDTEKLYDAYVAYSVKDEIWVNRILSTQLQIQNGKNSPCYKLCLHYKEFPVSVYMSDKILEAVESSKMTILVLSKNFIQSEWCRFEFKSALHSALRGKRKKLIAVTLGDLPTRDLDPDLRVALRSATVLSANDKHFLTKLRCALPDPTFSTTNINTTSRGLLISPTESISGHNYQRTTQNDQGLDVHSNFSYLNGNETMGRNQVFSQFDYTLRRSNDSSSVVVPVFVPPFPPPNRPPPPFPVNARGPPPPIPPLRR